ncbi:hypothetical protein GCM10009087_49450 [Sphingomonas oligophenolica]
MPGDITAKQITIHLEQRAAAALCDEQFIPVGMDHLSNRMHLQFPEASRKIDLKIRIALSSPEDDQAALDPQIPQLLHDMRVENVCSP